MCITCDNTFHGTITLNLDLEVWPSFEKKAKVQGQELWYQNLKKKLNLAATE